MDEYEESVFLFNFPADFKLKFMDINKKSIIAIAVIIVGVAVFAAMFLGGFNGKRSMAAILFGSGREEQSGQTFKKAGEIPMSELAGLSGCDLPAVPNGSAANYDSLAKCLSDKGVKMYGAYWCPHCQNQKKAFGDSFKYINYIECADGQNGQTQICKDNGITGYPTWEFPGKAQ